MSTDAPSRTSQDLLARVDSFVTEFREFLQDFIRENFRNPHFYVRSINANNIFDKLRQLKAEPVENKKHTIKDKPVIRQRFLTDPKKSK